MIWSLWSQKIMSIVPSLRPSLPPSLLPSFSPLIPLSSPLLPPIPFPLAPSLAPSAYPSLFSLTSIPPSPPLPPSLPPSGMVMSPQNVWPGSSQTSVAPYTPMTPQSISGHSDIHSGSYRKEDRHLRAQTTFNL